MCSKREQTIAKTVILRSQVLERKKLMKRVLSTQVMAIVPKGKPELKAYAILLSGLVRRAFGHCANLS